MHLRERRIENEWNMLQLFADANPGIVEVLGRQPGEEETLFRIALHETTGIFQSAEGIASESSHLAVVRFTRFFPSVPIELNLQLPVFHPNVDPANGFVCLWNRFDPSDNVIEGLRRLQLVISWSSVNLDAIHVVQPDAVKWYQDTARETKLPLEFSPTRCPEASAIERRKRVNPRPPIRRRLEPIPD